MSILAATDKNILKLPKWAQHYIEKLTKDIEYLEEQLTEVTSVESSANSTSWSTGLERERFLPQHASVKFVLNEDKHDWLRVRKSNENEGGTIKVESSGTIILLPRASNVVTIKNKDY